MKVDAARLSTAMNGGVFPSLAVPSQIGVRVLLVGSTALAKHVIRAAGPHPFIYSAV
jgi:hypothetical protein